MLKRIFVDTVFVIALVNHKDRSHQQASVLAKQYEKHPLLVTDSVLIEIGNALAKNYKHDCIRIIEQFFDSEEMKVVRLTPFLFEQALELYRSYKDKAWGLTDCISFVVMKNEGITQALTFDRHFVQAGFQALMREIADL